MLGLLCRSRNAVLEIELKDKKKIISGLRKALEEQRAKEKKAEATIANAWAERMEQQKKEFEQAMERHLKYIS